VIQPIWLQIHRRGLQPAIQIVRCEPFVALLFCCCCAAALLLRLLPSGCCIVAAAAAAVPLRSCARPHCVSDPCVDQAASMAPAAQADLFLTIIFVCFRGWLTRLANDPAESLLSTWIPVSAALL
jgi:hypothetical protein